MQEKNQIELLHDVEDQKGLLSNKNWLESPGMAFRDWKESQRVHHKEFSPHSIEQYETMFNAYLRWLSERNISMQFAKPEHLDLFLSSKMGRDGKSAAQTTRRRYLHLLKNVYEHLRLLEIRKDNPADPLVDLTKNQAFEKPAPIILSFELADRYINWTLEQPSKKWVDSRNKALRLIFLCSGVRVSEVQSLQPGDCLTDAGVTVLDIRPHGFVQARRAPVAEIASSSLLSWKSELLTIEPDSMHLFPARYFTIGHDHPDTVAISSEEAFLIVQEAMNAIGYDRARQGPQTLRNTFIARQIWSGKQTNKIMQWCGLQTSDSIKKIERLVPVRQDRVAPS